MKPDHESDLTRFFSRQIALPFSFPFLFFFSLFFERASPALFLPSSSSSSSPLFLSHRNAGTERLDQSHTNEFIVFSLPPGRGRRTFPQGQPDLNVSRFYGLLQDEERMDWVRLVNDLKVSTKGEPCGRVTHGRITTQDRRSKSQKFRAKLLY